MRTIKLIGGGVCTLLAVVSVLMILAHGASMVGTHFAVLLLVHIVLTAGLGYAAFALLRSSRRIGQ
jgi:hypothetical protein